MISINELNNPYAKPEENDAIRSFLGALIIDKGIIQNKQKLFYDDKDKQVEDIFRVLDEKLFKNFKVIKWSNIQFAPDAGIVKEFFNNQPFVFKLPICPGKKKDISIPFNKLFLGPLVKAKVIDDLVYIILKNVITTMGIYYNSEEQVIGFGVKQKSADVRLGDGKKRINYSAFELTLEDVLQSEVEQGFINVEIGDPNRQYAYTHLLREHAKFRLTTWAKKCIMNWKKYNVLACSRGQGKCQHKDSRILLSDGSYKKAIDIRVGDKIMGSKYGEEQITNVEYFKKKTVKITLDNGMSKIVSFDHRMPTQINYNNGLWDTDETKYKEANQLKKGDKIPLAFGYETFRKDFNKEDLMLYGYFLGDGTRSKNYIYGNHNRLLDVVKNYKITVEKQKGCNRYCIHNFKQNNNFEGIDELSYDKFIDKRIFAQTKELKFNFLEGLFNTDSYLGIPKTGVCLEYCTTSKLLANDLIELLYSVGIMAIIKEKNVKTNFNKTNELAYFVNITNRPDLKYLFSKIDLSNKKNYSVFLERINEDVLINNNLGTIPLKSFSEKTVRGIAKGRFTFYGGVRKPKYDFQKWKLKNYGITGWGDYSWHNIRSVEELGEDDVVSIEISGDDKLYFANGIMSHNTYLAALLSFRALLDSRPGFGGRNYQEIKYFVPNKEDIGAQVMGYMKNFIGKMGTHKLASGKKAFEIGTYGIKCNITGNNFKIISLHNYGSKDAGLGSSQGEGIATDVAIIDEAARIPDEFWVSFHQRAAFETKSFFIISTINEETPVDHWFYKLLIDGETGNENIYTDRVTIDDNEIMRYGKSKKEWEDQLESVKKDLRSKGDKEFYSKGYCIILDESNVFNLGGVIVHSNESKYHANDVRVLGFDLAKLTDDAGLVLINLTHREIESAIRVRNMSYGMQIQYAKEYKQKYKNLLIIGDRSGVGEAVSEMDTGGHVDTWIKSTGEGSLKYNKTLKFYTANKGFIITNFAGAINTNLIKIPNHNVDLIAQMQNFVKLKSGRGEVILYKGKGASKDDLVLSAAYAILYVTAILKLKTVEDIADYVKESGIGETYLYNDTEDYQKQYFGGLY